MISLRSQPELGGGVVLPCLVDPDVLPEGRHGAVPGLVRDGPVARSPMLDSISRSSSDPIVHNRPSR